MGPRLHTVQQRHCSNSTQSASRHWATSLRKLCFIYWEFSKHPITSHHIFWSILVTEDGSRELTKGLRGGCCFIRASLKSPIYSHPIYPRLESSHLSLYMSDIPNECAQTWKERDGTCWLQQRRRWIHLQGARMKPCRWEGKMVNWWNR